MQELFHLFEALEVMIETDNHHATFQSCGIRICMFFPSIIFMPLDFNEFVQCRQKVIIFNRPEIQFIFAFEKKAIQSKYCEANSVT